MGSKEEADAAIANTNNFKFDAKHFLKVNAFSDLQKYSSLPEEFIPKEPPVFKPRPDPTSWLSDPRGRDQFVTRYSNETEIYWSSTIPDEMPTLEYGGEREKKDGKVRQPFFLLSSSALIFVLNPL